jgi:hypothetical protein
MGALNCGSFKRAVSSVHPDEERQGGRLFLTVASSPDL